MILQLLEFWFRLDQSILYIKLFFYRSIKRIQS